jgi:hemerythrin-like domain-containing protein
METNRQTSRALGDEHRANLDLLGRAEQAFSRPPRGGAADEALLRAVAELDRHLRQELERHFEFEERELFPRMADAGEGDIAELLREEHDAIRAVSAELAPLIDTARAGSLDAAGWKTLARLALELTERQVAHIQKEEMSLLPLLDDLLDDETDRDLALAYASS